MSSEESEGEYDVYGENVNIDAGTEDDSGPAHDAGTSLEADDEGAGPDEEEPGDAGETDEEPESAGESEVEGEEEAEPTEPAGASQRAQPQRPRPDHLARENNRHRAIIVVAPEDRVTDHRLQKTEAANVIAKRAEQIATAATCFVKGSRQRDPVALAVEELLARRCPLIVQRVVDTGPDGSLIVEEWPVREMALPPLADLLRDPAKV